MPRARDDESEKTDKKQRRTQEQRTASTRGALLEAAAALFAERGFRSTSIEDILAASGIKRGALYHHFASKTELFQAVFEEQEKQMMAVVSGASGKGSDGWSGFRAGCEAFLEACLDPALQRIVLIDAPAILGWEAMREIEYRYSRALLEQGLAQAMAEGALAKRPVRPLANFLLGALSESAMSIARADDPDKTMRAARRELGRLLDALARS